MTTTQSPSPFYDSTAVDLMQAPTPATPSAQANTPDAPALQTRSSEPGTPSIWDEELEDARTPGHAEVKTRANTQSHTQGKTQTSTEADLIRRGGAQSKETESAEIKAHRAEDGSVKFADLGLDDRILAAVTAEGYETPTPIQARCITPGINGKDVLGCAQTGTGKTAAFSLPLLHRLLNSTKRPLRGPGKQNQHTKRLPRALVLSPTRELADQIAESLKTYGSGTDLRGTVIYGGVSQFRQVKSLQRGVDIIVATPGRLLDLMDQGYVDLSNIEMFVLDEADRMLDMGFINPIRKISQAFTAKPQTLLFSATMPKPIAQLADTLLTNPERIMVNPVSSAVPLIEQSLYLVDGPDKPALLTHMLENEAVERAVVFIRTKHGAEKLAKVLGKAGIKAESIHGNKNQNQRTRALDAFRSGRSRVLVATDVAARGLDVDGITHVFNFSIPNEPEAYVHRIGRTGRAGSAGKAIAFCARDERGDLYAIERLTKKTLETTPLPEELGLNEEPPLKRKMPNIGNKPNFAGRKGRRGPKPAGDRPAHDQAGKPSTNGKKRARRGQPNAHGSHSAHGGKSGHQPAGGRAKKAKNRG